MAVSNHQLSWTKSPQRLTLSRHHSYSGAVRARRGGVAHLALLSGPPRWSEPRGWGCWGGWRRPGPPWRPAGETSPTLGTASQTARSGCDTCPPGLVPLTTQMGRRENSQTLKAQFLGSWLNTQAWECGCYEEVGEEFGPGSLGESNLLYTFSASSRNLWCRHRHLLGYTIR